MIIYYKTASGKWINALTGQNITVPTTFEVEVTDLVKEGNITLTNPNYETQELDKGDIYPSTYVIGDYIYTRNSNKKYNYDGKLTTQRIMLASRTLTSDKEEDMIIYYKTARGIWIDALTGHEVTPTQKLNISTVDLINQKNDNMEVYLSSGTVSNQKIKQLAGNANATYSTIDENITKFIRETNVNNIPNGVIGNSNYLISASDSYKPIYAWYNNGVIYYYSEDSIIYLNSNSNSMFSRLTKIVEIDVSSFNTSKVTSMSGMFSGCSSLTSLDLISFDTSKVTDMSSMFDSCRSLSNLRLSSFNTSNVTDGMFLGCESLTGLDLSSFDTSKVTNMASMFASCGSITTAWARTSSDAVRFNASSYKPTTFTFVVKP